MPVTKPVLLDLYTFAHHRALKVECGVSKISRVLMLRVQIHRQATPGYFVKLISAPKSRTTLGSRMVYSCYMSSWFSFWLVVSWFPSVHPHLCLPSPLPPSRTCCLLSLHCQPDKPVLARHVQSAADPGSWRMGIKRSSHLLSDHQQQHIRTRASTVQLESETSKLKSIFQIL